MTYKIRVSQSAKKNIDKLDSGSRKQIMDYLNGVLARASHPRMVGKSLLGDKKGLWRYRTGCFRIICEIKDKELLILVIEVGHRKNVYD